MLQAIVGGLCFWLSIGRLWGRSGDFVGITDGPGGVVGTSDAFWGPRGDGPIDFELEPKNPPKPEIREQKDEVKPDLVEIQQSYGSA